MKDIRLYDFEFNLLHIENDILSSNWTIKYNDIGSFEAHFPQSSKITNVAMLNQYMVAVQGDFQAIITGKQIADGKIILYGKTVNWILSRRSTNKFSTYQMDIGINAEDIARYVVLDAFKDVDNFVLDDKVGLLYEKHFWRNTTNPTNEVVIDCLNNAEAGHCVFFDRANKRWLFKIYVGAKIPLVISKSNRNAYSMEFVENLQDFYTGGVYESFTDEGIVEGEESVWIYIEADSTKEGIYRWEGILRGNTESEANASLVAKQKKSSLKINTRALKFGVDYNLGDVVRVQSEFGTYKNTEEKRIVGVNSWFEYGNIGEEPIFE